MKDTKIEWCDHSWSPWRGCTKVSPGCANCYAETLSKRNPAVLGQWGRGKPRVKAKNWTEPVKWGREWSKANWPYRRGDKGPITKNPTVFPSLCDWLDEEVPVEWLAEFLQLIHDTPKLTWLLLTKRPENWPLVRMALTHVLASPDDARFTNTFTFWLQDWCDGHPPQNVWVGTSVEDQANADRRIPELLKIPARGRFLSLEPLLGPVTLPVGKVMTGFPRHITAAGNAVGAPLSIRWLIIGGESGNGSRPCDVEWIRSLVRQGKGMGVPTFVKQLGAYPVSRKIDCDEWPEHVEFNQACIGITIKLTHPKGGDPAEWPEDLRVREFPMF